MTPQTAFRRKIVYLVGIAALLALLSFLGRPATRGSGTTPGSPGGLLAQAREQHGLCQTQLGQIDPTVRNRLERHGATRARTERRSTPRTTEPMSRVGRLRRHFLSTIPAPHRFDLFAG